MFPLHSDSVTIESITYDNRIHGWTARDSTHVFNGGTTEVRKKTDEDELLIMDNCGGHEGSISLAGI